MPNAPDILAGEMTNTWMRIVFTDEHNGVRANAESGGEIADDALFLSASELVRRCVVAEGMLPLMLIGRIDPSRKGMAMIVLEREDDGIEASLLFDPNPDEGPEEDTYSPAQALAVSAISLIEGLIIASGWECSEGEQTA